MSEANTNITATPGTPAPPKPAAPARPAAPKAPAKADKGRRFFLLGLFGSWIAVAWMALTMSVLAMIVGTVRFLFPNVLSEPPSKVKVGTPDQFEDEKVVERFKDQNIWVVRHEGKIYA